MQIGYIGLGKMGKNMVLRLLEHGHQIVAWNRSPEPVAEVVQAGAQSAETIENLVVQLPTPRTVWVMLPAGTVTTGMIEKLSQLLDAGDTVMDGANSFYKDSKHHADLLQAKKINFIDVGVSGGPGGARNGACLMIGGEEKNFLQHEDLFKDIAQENACQFFPGYGAGHFVKMVHNGIEYGMMQAIAEGFAVLKQGEYAIPLERAADIYNHGSVIESRLVGWLQSGLQKHGEEMPEISGKISHSGEGQWTVETAKEIGIEIPIIEGSLQYRIDSQQQPSYIGQLVSLLRNQFGGHDVSAEAKK